MTFRQCGESYVASHKAGWGAKHIEQWTCTLATYVYPFFGDSPVQAVDTDMVVKALEPIWSTRTETASRVRGRIELVLDWAKVKGYRAGDNPARWRGHIDKLLPAKGKVRKVEHHPALPYKDIPALMAPLRRRERSSTASALEFCILTAARTSEVLGAHRNEINFDESVWTIPAERMKMRREHRVPLVGRSLEIAKDAPSGLLFPGQRREELLYEDSMLQLLRRMRVHVTVHGFRSTFRTWAAEQTNFPREVAELALAHSVGDGTEQAYQRGDLFVKRRAMMADWDAFCSSARQAG
jgi:integrase